MLDCRSCCSPGCCTAVAVATGLRGRLMPWPQGSSGVSVAATAALLSRRRWYQSCNVRLNGPRPRPLRHDHEVIPALRHAFGRLQRGERWPARGSAKPSSTQRARVWVCLCVHARSSCAGLSHTMCTAFDGGNTFKRLRAQDASGQRLQLRLIFGARRHGTHSGALAGSA